MPGTPEAAPYSFSGFGASTHGSYLISWIPESQTGHRRSILFNVAHAAVRHCIKSAPGPGVHFPGYNRVNIAMVNHSGGFPQVYS